MSIFQNVKANITNNSSLYNVQKEAYKSALSHYKEFTDFSHRETLIVMPTGTGKTGVMSILPFGISNGRVLIITPGKIVRKTVYGHFDSVENPERTFWIKQKVIFDKNSLPKSYLYRGFNPKNEGEKELTIKKLRESDIVITNVHKLGSSNEEVNLMNLIAEDFFDMIIIDEAHHVAASMWKDALKYFKASKVIKLTATPFRSDKLEISTHEYDPIFEYSLGEAINDNLVKNIVKQEEIPGSLSFYDKVTNKVYSLEEAKEELGNSFVNKSIAMSETCSKQIIDKTKEILITKRKSYPKHQVLAVTCNDEHAQDICNWFNELGLKSTYVSTRSLSEKEIELRLSDFANGNYDVMVSIQMLGEGYDNPNISIIALFRPFKTLGPYAQAIGRGLRKIHDYKNSIDNFCNVIYHQELGLSKLWEYYKDQESYGEIIKRQKEDIFQQLSFDFDELGFIEKLPTNKPKKEDNEDDLSSVSVANVLNVTSYTSKGLGFNDAFTANGYDDYKAVLEEFVRREEAELEDYKNSLEDRISKGEIEPFEAELLLNNKQQQAQNQVNQSYSSFEELIISESLRSDFTLWLNNKFEEFFKVSTLKKEEFDLYIENKSIDNKPINNIGYISLNIRRSLYNETKKNISLYTPTDFARAKDRVIEKLSYLLTQYGRVEED